MGKKLVLFIFLLLLFTSCHTTRKVVTEEHQKIDTVEKEKTNKTISYESVFDGISKSIDTSNEKVNVNIVIYDTSLPVDSITGKPPIKAEFKIDKERQNNIQEDCNISSVETGMVIVEKDYECDKEEWKEPMSTEYKEVGASDSLRTSLTLVFSLLLISVILILLIKIFKHK